MKFDFESIKEKLFSKKKNENTQVLDKSNIILLSILIVGILLAFVIYFLYKNLIYSVICIVVCLIALVGFKIYSNSKSKIKDDEIDVKVEFINRLVENLIAKQNPSESIYNSVNEIKSSVFKDEILNNYNQEESNFNKIELEGKQLNEYDVELFTQINNLSNKKYSNINCVDNLIDIKNKMLSNKSKFNFEMCQNLILGVCIVFYVYYILMMIFN